MLSIFAYHAHPQLVPGAAISVDAFFVMSAFLITTLLVREHDRAGTVDLRAFYRRRVVRLFPAQWLLVPVIAVLAYLVIGPPHVVGSALSTLFYYANFRSAADPRQMSVFLPTWSLSTEEQFYVVWPTVLLLLLRLRVPARAQVGLVGVVLVVATGWLQWSFDHGTSESAIAYRPDLRISGILIGTLVGLLFAYDLVPEGARVLVRAGTLLGTAWVVLYLWFPLQLPREVIITLAIVAACAAFGFLVLQQVRWPVRGYSLVLEQPLLVWVGRASYVLYLVHVPALRISSSLLGHPSWQVRMLVGGAITLVVGWLVHEKVEKPALRFKSARSSAARSLGSTGA
ncbi:MAG: peptidoglycan-N-acetylmuramate O-acetyltransferase [Frankiales bacterium]|nr:peptidoglycan-N-acetylmuramate O-acetyltransferase [Frankiales bacterium]